MVDELISGSYLLIDLSDAFFHRNALFKLSIENIPNTALLY